MESHALLSQNHIKTGLLEGIVFKQGFSSVYETVSSGGSDIGVMAIIIVSDVEENVSYVDCVPYR